MKEVCQIIQEYGDVNLVNVHLLKNIIDMLSEDFDIKMFKANENVICFRVDHTPQFSPKCFHIIGGEGEIDNL